MAGSQPGERFIQLVQPNTTVEDAAGYCLRFSQSVFRAPVKYGSAKEASDATTLRHYERDMPNVSVLVWFDHYGTYGGVYKNWGHVVPWIPGHGFLSSPPAGYGQRWYPTLDAVERAFNAKFLFTSEDINGLRVAEPTGTPVPQGEETMYIMESSRGAALIGGGRGYEGLDTESRDILQARKTADGTPLYPTIQVNEREWDVLAALHYVPVANAKEIAAEVVSQLPAGDISEQDIVNAIVSKLTS